MAKIEKDIKILYNKFIMEKIIYIIEDEKDLRNIEKSFLEEEGFIIYDYESVEKAKKDIEKIIPDLIILDIMLKGVDGLTFLTEIKQKYNSMPVIIVSAKDKPIDRLTGLNYGCDEYIIKPFLPMELVMNVKKILKEKKADTNIYKVNNVEVLEKERIITISKKEIKMSPNAFDFLLTLIKNEGGAVREEDLLNEVWNIKERDLGSRLCDDLVKRIRKKLKECKAKVEIETVWGYGYRIRGINEKN